MQDLTAILLGYGGLLIGYGSPLIAYFTLRKKAQRNFPGRPIVQIPWWKLFCWFLSSRLFLGASMWTVATASLFANLVSSLDETCPFLITPDECRRAAHVWQLFCVGLVEFALAAVTIIAYTTYAEANRTASPPERAYPLMVLTCSHCLLVVSWLLCTPLTYPLNFFSFVGTKRWTSASSAFAFVAIVAYIFGTALWIIALIRVFCAWWRRSMSRIPAGDQWPGEPERDFVLQEV